MRKHFLLIGMALICFNYAFSQSINEYEIEINKELWKTEPIHPLKYIDKKYLKDGNLYVHFQSAFKNDSVRVKVNENFYGKYELITEWSTGVADVIKIPGFEKIKTVGMTFNNGKEAIIEIDKLNQIIVRYRNEKLLIGFRKHVPYYD